MNISPGQFSAIEKPCVEAQVLAVRHDPVFYSRMSNPHEDITVEYVKHRHDSIGKVKNASKRVKWAAIMAHAEAIHYIKDPDPMMVMTAQIIA